MPPQLHQQQVARPFQVLVKAGLGHVTVQYIQTVLLDYLADGAAAAFWRELSEDRWAHEWCYDVYGSTHARGLTHLHPPTRQPTRTRTRTRTRTPSRACLALGLQTRKLRRRCAR